MKQRQRHDEKKGADKGVKHEGRGAPNIKIWQDKNEGIIKWKGDKKVFRINYGMINLFQ